MSKNVCDLRIIPLDAVVDGRATYWEHVSVEEVGGPWPTELLL